MVCATLCNMAKPRFCERCKRVLQPKGGHGQDGSCGADSTDGAGCSDCVIDCLRTQVKLLREAAAATHAGNAPPR